MCMCVRVSINVVLYITERVLFVVVDELGE